MKYPKLWNGSSPVGESLVRALHATGEPFLRASTADGVTAGTMNGLQEVRQGGDDLFLTVGAEDPGDLNKFTVRASGGVRKLFIEVGSPIDRPFNIPSIVYGGGGLGLVTGAISASEYRVFTTRRGGKFKHIFTLLPGAGDEYAPSRFWVTACGVVLDPDDARQSAFAIATLNQPLSGDEVWFLYSASKGANWTIMSAAFGTAFRLGIPYPTLVAPGVMWLAAPIYKMSAPMALASGRYPEQHASHFSQLLRFSIPAQSVTAVSAGAVINGVVDHPDYDYSLYNADLAALLPNLLFTPLIDGTVLAVAPARYYDRAWTGSGFAGGDDAVAVFRGTQTGGFVRVATVSNPAWFGWPYSLILIGDVPVFVVRDEAEGGGAALVVGSEDGTAWDVRPIQVLGESVTPIINRHVGNVIATDPHALVLSGYDARQDSAGYALFESRDLGETWRRRARVSKAGTPPFTPGGGLVRLIQYGFLTHMQQGGRPAHVRPGAPWIGDGRFTPPWEQT